MEPNTLKGEADPGLGGDSLEVERLARGGNISTPTA